MTPFMIRVAELLGTAPSEPVEPLMYRTRPSAPGPVNVGVNHHVAIRALAEQLLCEANAVIDDEDDRLDLVDETVPAELRFSVLHRGRAVQVSTVIDHGVAVGRLIGDGIQIPEERELATPEDVAELLLQMLSMSGPAHHPVSG